MSERYRQPEVPRADYPLLFGGNVPQGFEAAHESNSRFVNELIPPTAEGYTPFDGLIVEACAKALTEADHRLGRNTGELGTMCDGDGLWLTLPVFYHNGDGTRLAMLGTTSYMDYVNRREGAQSPYTDRRTYLATLTAAAFDDIVFGVYGRVGDEKASSAIAKEYLHDAGVDESFTSDVTIAIESSIFDEISKKQRYNPALGAEPIQRGSLVGDLWPLGLPQSTVNFFSLIVENLWKLDSGLKIPELQVLRNAALNEFLQSTEADIDHPWRGRKLHDFFALAQKHDVARTAFADSLTKNPKFLLEIHTYNDVGDVLVDGLMQAGKMQNAELQTRLGRAIEQRHMTIDQAYHCALAYADASARRAKKMPNVPVAQLGASSPEQISRLLLTEYSEADIGQPISAASFFSAYKAVHSIA